MSQRELDHKPLGKRALRRQRGQQAADTRLNAARIACRSFPAAVVASPVPAAGLASALPRPYVAQPIILPSRPAEPKRPLARGTPPARRAPVAGRVRLALDRSPPDKPRTLVTRPGAMPAPVRDLLAQTRREVVELTAARRQRGPSSDRRLRQAVAAALLAPLALAGLLSADPFGWRTPSAPRGMPEVAAVPPTVSTPSQPSVVERPPVIAVAPATAPTPAVEATQATPPPAVPLSDPPDGHLREFPRLAQPLPSALPLPAALPPPSEPRIEIAALPPVPPASIPATPDLAPVLAAPAPALPDSPAATAPTLRSGIASIDAAATVAVPDGGRETPTAGLPAGSGRLPIEDAPSVTSAPAVAGHPILPAAFELTRIPGGYDPKYMKIAYPMGDVPVGWGVCSDVIVRAFRGVGVDLQQLVRTERLGTGDTNVDHRRVTVLMKFFQKNAQTVPITAFPESYKPGDIVAYDVPWGRTSKWHIAIVSDRLSPSLRPMIVHNRGYGAKLEDALFHKRIIGHYRLDDTTIAGLQAKMTPTQPAAPAQAASAPAKVAAKAQSRLIARVVAPPS